MKLSAIGSLLVIGVGLTTSMAQAETLVWPVNETTTGNDVHWVSPTPTDPGAGLYRVQFVIDQVIANVKVLIFTVPFDISDQLDPNFLNNTILVDGPAPVSVNTLSVGYPTDTPDITASLDITLDESGYGRVDVTNVMLGKTNANVPGFGDVEVDVLSIQLIGTLYVTDYPFGDLNCSGAVDAFDIDPFVLALLAPDVYTDVVAGACSINLADTNGSGGVDAFDIDSFVDAVLSGGGS